MRGEKRKIGWWVLKHAMYLPDLQRNDSKAAISVAHADQRTDAKLNCIRKWRNYSRNRGDNHRCFASTISLTFKPPPPTASSTLTSVSRRNVRVKDVHSLRRIVRLSSLLAQLPFRSSPSLQTSHFQSRELRMLRPCQGGMICNWSWSSNLFAIRPSSTLC